MRDLLRKLESAALRRSPALATMLQPPLTEKKIHSNLKRAGVEGLIDPILAIYTWRNGTRIPSSSIEDAKQGRAPLPPRMLPLSESDKELLAAVGAARDTWPENYHLLDLKTALSIVKSIRSRVQHSPDIAYLVGRYVPLLTESYFAGMIAVDIDPSTHNRVVKIQLRPNRDQHLLRLAYASFADFLDDAIRCNEANKPLTCLLLECEPIHPPPQVANAPADGESASKKIPATEDTLVLRTDFSDDAAWKSLQSLLENTDDEFAPGLDFISDPAFDGLAAEQLKSMLSDAESHTFAFIIDRTTLSDPDHPILLVDLAGALGKTFRVIPAAAGEVASNLSIANMDFDEFAQAAGPDGVFRGFP